MKKIAWDKFDSKMYYDSLNLHIVLLDHLSFPLEYKKIKETGDSRLIYQNERQVSLER